LIIRFQKVPLPRPIWLVTPVPSIVTVEWPGVKAVFINLLQAIVAAEVPETTTLPDEVEARPNLSTTSIEAASIVIVCGLKLSLQVIVAVSQAIVPVPVTEPELIREESLQVRVPFNTMAPATVSA
jgi:hypothetical protein